MDEDVLKGIVGGVGEGSSNSDNSNNDDNNGNNYVNVYSPGPWDQPIGSSCRPGGDRTSSPFCSDAPRLNAEAEHSNRGPALRTSGPHEPARPSGAGIPARTVDESLAFEHLQHTV